MHLRTLLTLALFLLAAPTAWAQDARSVLARETRPGDVLTIEVRNLGTLQGKLVKAGADVLEIEFGHGTRPVKYGDIDQVRRRRNGRVFGTTVGGVVGFIYGLGALGASGGDGGSLSQGVTALILLTAGGTAIGWVIDGALSVNRTVYRRSPTSVGFDVVPHRGGAGVRVTARW